MVALMLQDGPSFPALVPELMGFEALVRPDLGKPESLDPMCSHMPLHPPYAPIAPWNISTSFQAVTSS